MAMALWLKAIISTISSASRIGPNYDEIIVSDQVTA
jgi:hypothetical protein